MKKNKIVLTLVIVLSKGNDKILLGMKKRGFGKGLWNGFGGKLLAGENLEEAAHRELTEEAGIKAENLKKRGVLIFYEADPQPLQVNIFSANAIKGDPKESEEMRPYWFKLEDIPYSNMWPDDSYWLPLLISGKNFEGEFWFKDKNNTDRIVKYKLKELKG